MSNVLAGIGLGQMEILDERVKSRRNNHFFYKKHLENFKEISFLDEPDKSYFSNFWVTTILIDPLKTSVSRDLACSIKFNTTCIIHEQEIEDNPP